jgi:hypothetical protein
MHCLDMLIFEFILVFTPHLEKRPLHQYRCVIWKQSYFFYFLTVLHFAEIHFRAATHTRGEVDVSKNSGRFFGIPITRLEGVSNLLRCFSSNKCVYNWIFFY